MDEQGPAEALGHQQGLEAGQTTDDEFEAEVGDAGKEKDDGVSGQDIGL